jgi:hypothetical protein
MGFHKIQWLKFLESDSRNNFLFIKILKRKSKTILPSNRSPWSETTIRITNTRFGGQNQYNVKIFMIPWAEDLFLMPIIIFWLLLRRFLNKGLIAILLGICFGCVWILWGNTLAAILLCLIITGNPPTQKSTPRAT